FQPQIIVQLGGGMFLHDESGVVGRLHARGTSRLRGFREVAFTPVRGELAERHQLNNGNSGVRVPSCCSTRMQCMDGSYRMRLRLRARRNLRPAGAFNTAGQSPWTCGEGALDMRSCVVCGRPLTPLAEWRGSDGRFYCSEFCAEAEDAPIAAKF